MTSTKSFASSNYIGCGTVEPTKPLSRVERTKSFLKASLIKKWKSSKELFSKPLSSFTNNDNNVKSSRKKIETQLQNGKFINEKVLENLDEFERNFLLSAGRKILVRELRKNFEKPQNTQISDPCNNKGVIITVNSGAVKPKASNLQANEKPKKFANASVQTIPNYEEISYETKTITNYDNQKRCPLVTRHSSFYNTYRNEYCAWQNQNHYASNLSLLSCGIPSSSERCLEKTINKYKNSIKSSSAVDLSSIVLNTAMPTIAQSIEKSSSMRQRHYSSIVNIGHSNSSQNLTDLTIIGHDYGLIDPTATSYPMYENVKTVQKSINNSNCNNKNKNKNTNNSSSQLKSSHSIKSLNTVSSTMHDGINNANVNVRFRNGDYDTKSMIVTSSVAVSCEPPQNTDFNACHFNRFVSNTDLHGSNVSLTIVSENDSHNNSINHNNNNNNNNNHYVYNSSINCHNRNLNSDSIAETNASHNNHDGNNNTTTKIRKCYSINQIDLGLLKNELDEYIDRELRTTNFGRNTLAQRRCQFENNLKKVTEKLIAFLFVV